MDDDEIDQIMIDMTIKAIENIDDNPALKKYLEALMASFDKMKREEVENHPFWPLRGMIVAISRNLPRQGRTTALIAKLTEAGLSDLVSDPKMLTAKVFGRWLKRATEHVEQELASKETERTASK